MERYLVVSADAHAGPPDEVIRGYFERKYLAAFDEFAAERREHRATSDLARGQQFELAGARRAAYQAHPSLQPGGHLGLSDPHRRLRDMDADGVAAEVIFPDYPHLVSNDPPFGGVTTGRRLIAGVGRLERSREFYSAELQLAGARAYNRWLADFCAVEPERRGGVALVPFHDVSVAMQEVRWTKRAGLRGGLLLPGMDPRLPEYNDPLYDQLWSTCEELEMPLNSHGGHDMGCYGSGLDVGGRPVFYFEVGFFAHRPLWWFILGGIFDRHPRLRLCFAEQGADWVPETLRQIDAILKKADGSDPIRRGPTKGYSSDARGYWERFCRIGATAMRAADAAARFETGVGTIMWGTDYPHPEGTWPYTRQSLRRTFAGLPSNEVAAMLGGNAAETYHFDRMKLEAIAARIGPAVAEVAEPLNELPTALTTNAFS